MFCLNIGKLCTCPYRILFDDDSLEHKVNFEIKRIELMKDDMKEYHETADIQNLLRSFCKVRTLKK